MPSVFLSPSTQEFNPSVIGPSEEYYMNLLADALEPYLRAAGIRYGRNDPAGSVRESVALANAGDYDLHLALHSNAAGGELAGQLQGSDIYYYPGSRCGQALAELIAYYFTFIYPHPEWVGTVPNRNLYELRETRAPAVLAEVAYHDNPEDARWISENIEPLARMLALALTAYFDIPFVEPLPPRQATVVTGGSPLNIRSRPSLNAPMITTAPNGATMTMVGALDNWYVVEYGDKSGYAAAPYLIIS